MHTSPIATPISCIAPKSDLGQKNRTTVIKIADKGACLRLTSTSSRAALAPSCKATSRSFRRSPPADNLAFDRAASSRAGNGRYGWKTERWKLSPCFPHEQIEQYPGSTLRVTKDELRHTPLYAARFGTARALASEPLKKGPGGTPATTISGIRYTQPMNPTLHHTNLLYEVHLLHASGGTASRLQQRQLLGQDLEIVDASSFRQ